MYRPIRLAILVAVALSWAQSSSATLPLAELPRLDLQPLPAIADEDLSSTGLYRPASRIGPLDTFNSNPLTAPLQLRPAEKRLLLDAADGRLDQHSLVEGGLIASGTSRPDDITRLLARYESLRDDVAARISPGSAARDRIECILHVLHSEALRQYNANATNLAGAMETGIYNCASATLLFVALAGDAGLEAGAMEQPGHILAMVYDNGAIWEVEVTNPSVAQAIRRVDAGDGDESPRIAGGSAIGAKDIAQGRQVSPVGLLAAVYYNQAIDAFDEQRFADAVAANRRAIELDPNNAAAQGNLLAAINNWAMALLAAGQPDDAEQLLAAGRAYAPTHQPFVHNQAYLQRIRAERTSGRASLER